MAMADTFAASDDDFEATALASTTGGIVPVFISQLLSSTGKSCGKVCVRGILRNIEMSSTKYVYILEDNTGRIEAHYWLDEGRAPDIILNKYATAYASVKLHGGRKILTVYEIFPINNPNVMTTHNLEVMNAIYSF